MNEFQKSQSAKILASYGKDLTNDILEKGKKAELGTVTNYSGHDYVKTAEGWKPVKTHGHLVGKQEQSTSISTPYVTPEVKSIDDGQDITSKLSKLNSIDDFKNLIGDKTLVVKTQKDIAWGELDGRKKGSGEWDKLVAFKMQNGNIAYKEIESYHSHFLGSHKEKFTEITGKNNTYGPRENVSDDRILAFLKFNAKKNKAILTSNMIAPEHHDKLTILENEHHKSVKEAKDILKRNDATYQYENNHKQIPSSAVLHNHSSGMNELRYIHDGKGHSFNGGAHSSTPSLKTDGDHHWDKISVDRRFLTSSNSFNSNGYNRDYKVYKPSASEKKEVHKKLQNASDKWKEYSKENKNWYNKYL